MRQGLLVLAVLAFAIGTASPGTAASSGSAAVTPWIELELDAIASHNTNPPRASRALAHLSRAMYQAALPSGDGREDAVAGAAATVLTHLYPDETARVNALAAQVANPSSSAFARGTQVGQLVVARARTDGSDTVWTGSPPVGPGFWVPTPPAFLMPLEPLAGTWRTWNLGSGAELRPGPPPSYGSVAFNEELVEVHNVSLSLTAEQKRIAAFWADGPGTVTPPGHWNRIAIDLAGGKNWSTLRTTLLFAALNTAQADAFIACWDAKYAYWTLRPVTAINRLIDPAWLPFITTPPFPSYVSGHSTTSGAAATVLGAFFSSRSRQLDAMAAEAAVSRLYGGIHFRSDNDAGLELGRRVGAVAVQAYGLD
jgi:hypothetical protein